MEILNITDNDDLLKIKDLGLVIFNADNGIIVTDGVDILLFPNVKIENKPENIDGRYRLRPLPDSRYIKLGSEDTINVNDQTYKATIDNLKMIRIINYGNENFEFIGDLDNLKSKINKPEQQKIQKLKP